MSLGGIAIAVGAMVDAAIVMIENAHKRLEEWQHQHPDATLDNKTRWQVITNASVEVGPALFISLLIITLSFIPIFTPKGRKGVCLPAGVHQNVCDGGCGAAGDRSDPYPDGLLDPWQNSAGKQ